MTDRLSPADHLGAVSREIRDGSRDGQPQRVLIVRRGFAAAPTEVWDAVTTAERIARWIGPVTGELRLGGHYQIEGNAGGRITACEPPSRLALTWEYADQTSWVEVSLTPDGDGTRLRLEHSAPVPEEMWQQYGPGAVGIGWEMMLMGVAEHLADPDFSAAQAQAAMGTPEGMAWIGPVMAGSNAAWAEASVAAGTDPDEAAGAAERCLAAYTGQEEAAGSDASAGSEGSSGAPEGSAGADRGPSPGA